MVEFLSVSTGVYIFQRIPLYNWSSLPSPICVYKIILRILVVGAEDSEVALKFTNKNMQPCGSNFGPSFGFSRALQPVIVIHTLVGQIDSDGSVMSHGVVFAKHFGLFPVVFPAVVLRVFSSKFSGFPGLFHFQ